MTPSEQFNQERQTRLQAYGTDAPFKALSQQWLHDNTAQFSTVGQTS